jgi:ubiquinone/menaquinone biosynthesis C-methylase UbiE
MIAAHEAAVGARFDELEARFKAEVPVSDVRLQAILGALGPLRGSRILDFGCGKGRFAAQLRALGAEVIGLDRSAAMLAGASWLDRVRGSASRLPFAGSSFDAVIAIEVLEHLPRPGIDPALAEIRRVLRPGGRLAIVDKNAGALDARRPWLPSLALKWIDQRRGRWMYPAAGPVREHWFWPNGLRARLAHHFEDVTVTHPLTPAEARRVIFRRVPRVRLLTLWTARVPEVGP